MLLPWPASAILTINAEKAPSGRSPAAGSFIETATGQFRPSAGRHRLRARFRRLADPAPFSSARPVALCGTRHPHHHGRRRMLGCASRIVAWNSVTSVAAPTHLQPKYFSPSGKRRKSERPVVRKVVTWTATEALMKRCAHCGGPLGLIVHRFLTLRFCKLACKKAYGQKRREEVRKRFAHVALLAHWST